MHGTMHGDYAAVGITLTEGILIDVVAARHKAVPQDRQPCWERSGKPSVSQAEKRRELEPQAAKRRLSVTS